MKATLLLMVSLALPLLGRAMDVEGPLKAKYDLALQALQDDQPQLALDLLPKTTPRQIKTVFSEQIILARARALFQANQLKAAEAEYSRIPMSSDFWVVAIEERAQARGRQGNFQGVLSDLTSLRSPLFDSTRGPETYFIEALSYLKTCQYRKVNEAIDRFKKDIRPRAVALGELSKSGRSEALDTAIKNIKKSGAASTLSYAKIAGLLPERFHLDSIVQKEIEKTSPPASIALNKRMKEMASEDLAEIATTAKKLNFIEAEMLQRTTKLASAKGDRAKLGEFKATGAQLQFPYDGESWIDEIGSYQAKVEGCPDQGAK